MLNMKMPLRKNEFVQVKTVEGKKILFNLDDGIVLRVNDVSSFLWEMIDGHHSGQDLAQTLTERFEVEPGIAYQDTRGVLETFFKDEFIDYVK